MQCVCLYTQLTFIEEEATSNTHKGKLSYLLVVKGREKNNANIGLILIIL